MKNKILEIEKQALMIFNDEEYNIFVSLINENKINAARIYLENKIETLDEENYLVNSFIYNQLQDTLIDLIINEMDGEEKRTITNSG